MGIWDKMFGGRAKPQEKKSSYQPQPRTVSEKAFGKKDYHPEPRYDFPKKPLKEKLKERMRGSVAADIYRGVKSKAKDVYMRTPYGVSKIEEKINRNRAEKFAKRMGISTEEAMVYRETRPNKHRQQSRQESYPTWSPGTGMLGGSMLGGSMLGDSIFGGGQRTQSHRRRSSGKSSKKSGGSRTIIIKVPD